MENEKYRFYGKQAIIRTNGQIPATTKELLETPLFKDVVRKFLNHLRKTESPFLDLFSSEITEKEQTQTLIIILQKLAQEAKPQIITQNPQLANFFSNEYLLHQLVEQLYNFWRHFERFLVCYSKTKDAKLDKKPYRTFNLTADSLNDLVRKTYRDICENITGDHPRIYRQVPAGCQVGLIVVDKEKETLPDKYKKLEKIPIIRQVYIQPPLILDPPMNKRAGQFKKINFNPIYDIELHPQDWLCYPAKVGDLVINVYFHNKFIGLGTALSNLFELATDEEIQKKPDAIYAYGVSEYHIPDLIDCQTVFYDDAENDLLFGIVPSTTDFGYFGYLKKMMLTLHNIKIMKRGRLPVHGAMINITLKNGKSANVVIMGDTGAGKSESIEAFRTLGKTYIRDMTIIFDDMGSLDICQDGKIRAYGTETGAFVRLDDLQPGFAFGNIDRSIIMSPQKINARAILPITTLKEILHGHTVDYFLYANNYEEVDEDKPFFQEFKDKDDALSVFRQGARMAKGTTKEKGLVSAYFANIFGPVQYRQLHDGLADKYFYMLFSSGVRVAQLRTRLGIPGYETKGPEEAAKALFEEISQGHNKDNS